MGERFKGTFSEACFFLALLGWKYIRLHTAAVYKEAENGKNLQQEHTINSMLCSRTTKSLFWRNPIHNICVCMYGSHNREALASTSRVKRLKTWPNFNIYLLKKYIIYVNQRGKILWQYQSKQEIVYSKMLLFSLSFNQKICDDLKMSVSHHMH